ncbi:hypothetical protein DdX_07310 [Ditylenchus destructor]|uniref:Uncharacterized protein n=1 Tax=Ditylenchus destructor TaxID=166010 RepID=A0AAD4R800_9BILA|nr:hypothetical protein DdX_07310 [Ditylenchus destructor]
MALIRDALKHFGRIDLCRLRNVGCHFENTIETDFAASPPYLLLDSLEYTTDHHWKWQKDSDSDCLDIPDEVLSQLRTSKFVRFEWSHIVCDINLRPLDIMPFNHLWKGQNLRISWTDEFLPTTEFACALAECKMLQVDSGSGTVAVLRELLSNNCDWVSITDLAYAPNTVEMDWTAVKDYLLRPAGISDPGYIVSITTDEPPNYQETLNFINSVKEKFESAALRLKFHFRWNVQNEQAEYPSFSIRNSQIQQLLNLMGDTHGFALEAE